MKRIKINRAKLGELPKFRVGYGSASIDVPYPINPREGRCDSCHRSKDDGNIRQTNLHHWKYAYQHKTLKNNPLLVLDNLSELCFTCHGYGDAFRSLFEKDTSERNWMLMNTALLMPEDMKRRLDMFCRGYLMARKSDKKKIKLEEWFEE